MPGFAGIGIGRKTGAVIEDVINDIKNNIVLISVLGAVAYVVFQKVVK